jgi:hypothetical protein
VHLSNLNYRVVAEEFASLNPNGAATTVGWDLSYPLLRSLVQNINLAFSFDDKRFDNSINSVTTAYGIKAYNASLTWQQMDGWGGGGSSSASTVLTTGQKTNESPYTKLNISLGRLQKLSQSFSLNASATAQASGAEPGPDRRPIRRTRAGPRRSRAAAAPRGWPGRDSDDCPSHGPPRRPFPGRVQLEQDSETDHA